MSVNMFILVAFSLATEEIKTAIRYVQRLIYNGGRPSKSCREQVNNRLLVRISNMYRRRIPLKRWFRQNYCSASIVRGLAVRNAINVIIIQTICARCSNIRANRARHCGCSADDTRSRSGG